ncbi:MAG: SsrA-binding protein SmpB [Planctomycetota bacterium]|jgi:SsrA-binding protein
MASKKAPEPDGIEKLVAENRRARHQYEILERVEAGLVLSGTEVKTLRSGTVSLEEAYGRIEADAAWLVGAHIDEYVHGNRMNHSPTRKRKLLLRKQEIKRLHSKVTQKGLTLVPLRLYFKGGWAKLELALCKGKRLGDKREVSKKREADREMGRYR